MASLALSIPSFRSETPQAPLSLALLLCLSLAACGDDTSDETGSDVDAGTDTGTPDGSIDGGEGDADGGTDGSGGPIALDIPEGCNPLAFENDCFFPWPSDYFLAESDATVSGRAIEVTGAAQLINQNGLVSDFNELYQADGFSHHPIIAAYFPAGIDETALTAWQQDPAATLEADSVTLLINAETGEAVPHFAEVDARQARAEGDLLFIRPVVRLDNDTRYIVAIQSLNDDSGAAVAPPQGFAQLRDAVPTTSDALTDLGARYEADVFPVLETFGVDRASLVLAWDFTTQSLESVTNDMVTARNLALADFEANPPVVTILEVQEGSGEGGLDPDLQPNIYRRVSGTIRVPLVVDSSNPGARLNRDANGNVEIDGTAEARFSILIPRSVVEQEVIAPTRVVQFGHGFFGGLGEVDSSTQGRIANEGGWVIGGVEWWGMSAPDQGGVVESIVDTPSDTFAFTDRLHQGMVNSLAFAHAVQTTFQEEEAFQLDGTSLLSPDEIYFYGISQGHILGGVYFALSPVIERGVFSVGGASFTLMMSRAAPFTQFLQFISFNFDPLQVQKFIAMGSTAMDRVDPITYAPMIFDQPLEGAPENRRVLFQMGLGDTSVPNLSHYLHARSLNIPVLTPSAETPFLVQTADVGAEGQDISGVLIVDFGINPRPDIESRTAGPLNCVHGAVRELPFAIQQMSDFLRPDGVVTFPCEGACESSCD